MAIRLLVHLEPVGDQQVWWAESPDVPGFSASDMTLRDLLSRASWALTEIAEERGGDPASVDPVYELIGTSGSDNPSSVTVESGLQVERSDAPARVAVAS